MPDKGGWTPITWAAEHGQIAATKYLEHFSADINKADVVICFVDMIYVFVAT